MLCARMCTEADARDTTQLAMPPGWASARIDVLLMLVLALNSAIDCLIAAARAAADALAEF